MSMPPAIVRIVGDQDLATVRDLRAALQTAVGNKNLVVDLRGVSYMDSLAMNELVRAQVACERGGGRMAIVSRNQHLVQLLSLAGITSHVKIVDSINAALAYVEREQHEHESPR